MTIKECATFLSGGSATLEMLKETLTLTVGLDIKENNRYRVIVGPMDMVSFLLCSIMILLCFALI
jgi:predicted cupin superfamily sugar epimerase